MKMGQIHLFKKNPDWIYFFLLVGTTVETAECISLMKCNTGPWMITSSAASFKEVGNKN